MRARDLCRRNVLRSKARQADRGGRKFDANESCDQFRSAHQHWWSGHVDAELDVAGIEGGGERRGRQGGIAAEQPRGGKNGQGYKGKRNRGFQRQRSSAAWTRAS